MPYTAKDRTYLSQDVGTIPSHALTLKLVAMEEKAKPLAMKVFPDVLGYKKLRQLRAYDWLEVFISYRVYKRSMRYFKMTLALFISISFIEILVQNTLDSTLL